MKSHYKASCARRKPYFGSIPGASCCTTIARRSVPPPCLHSRREMIPSAIQVESGILQAFCLTTFSPFLLNMEVKVPLWWYTLSQQAGIHASLCGSQCQLLACYDRPWQNIVTAEAPTPLHTRCVISSPTPSSQNSSFKSPNKWEQETKPTGIC